MICKDTENDIIELGLTYHLRNKETDDLINNNFNLNMNWKEHLKSFFITFFVGFAMVFVADIDKLSLETLGDGALVGLVFGACRAGVKAVLELFIALYSSRK